MTPQTADHEDAARKRNLLEALYRGYSQALQRFLARHRLSGAEVADIVQETYCRIHQAGNIDTIQNPKAFLFRVATNVRLNARKHSSHRMESNAVDVGSIELEADDPSPYRRFQGEQELAIVRAALQELPSRCRDAFIMNRFENMTFGQIATELGVSVSLIEKHVSLAISHMRARLNEAQRSPARRNAGTSE